MTQEHKTPLSNDGHLRSELVTTIRWVETSGRPITSANLRSSLAPALREQAYLNDLLSSDDLARLDDSLAGGAGSPTAPTVLEDLRLTDDEGQSRYFHVTLAQDGHQGPDLLICAILVDTTAQHLAAEELRGKSQQLELAIEATRLGTWDWNPQTNEVTFGDYWAEMLGYAPEEIAPSLNEWQDRVHPDDLDACFQDIANHIEGKVDYYENVHRMRHKDGHWVHILDRGKVVQRDADGRPTRFTGTHTDISAQKDAELLAQDAATAKSQFLATMSHEIRTPITGILGLLQMLEDTSLDSHQHELLQTVNKCGDHLLTLVDDILNLAKIEAGEFSIVTQPFPLEGVIRTLLGLHAAQAHAKGIEFSCKLDPTLPDWIVSDSHRLIQLLSNLITNAIKFTKEGHVRVTLTAERDDSRSWLIAKVSDTGSGIKDTEAIWESFRQEDAQISRKHGGTGLGLAIVRQITELMGGSIEVSSEAGRGSTFSVRLPFVDAEVNEAAPRPADGEVPEQFRTLKVLVAEDNPINQRVIESLFRKLRIRIDMVSDGVQAVEKCVETAYDVIFMDVHMPGLDGIQASKEIAARLGAEAPPIYAITADVLSQSKERCQSAGMKDVIEKPVRLNKVIAALNREQRESNLDD